MRPLQASSGIEPGPARLERISSRGHDRILVKSIRIWFWRLTDRLPCLAVGHLSELRSTMEG
jgi:hypothetical protein